MTTARARRRWLRWAALGAVLLLVAGIGTSVLVLRIRGVLMGRSEELVAAVGRSVGLPIAAESVEVSWWPPGVTAHDLEIPDESPYGPGDLARADEARIEVALLPLLRGEIVVTEVRLLSPVLFVVRGFDGGWNVGATPVRRVSGAQREATSIGPAPTVTIDSIRVRNARLVYRDRAIPGLGELEIKSGNALLRRQDQSYRVDFNAQALGGPEENVEGWMVVPRGEAAGSSEAVLQIHASELAGARLPELIALLRGEIAFGISLDGKVGGRVDVQLPVAWPPTRAAGRLALDAREASLRAVNGWLAKPPGTALDVELELRAGAFGLAIDRASVASADLRLLANPAQPGTPPADAGQQPLVLALEGVDATRLAAWVPQLALASPRGDLSMEARITPGPGGVATDLRIATSQLALEHGGDTVTVASASLDLSLAHGSDGILGALRVAELRSPRGTIASMDASIGGSLKRPLDVRVDGARIARNGVEVDTASLDLVMNDGSSEIRSLKLSGLGGRLAARGRVLNDRDGVFTVALEPEWDDIDLARLTRLLGEEDAGSGIFGGRASLETSGDAFEAGLANLNGTFEATLGDGSLPGLNVARVTLANLDSVPRLKDAIDRRARERVPDLVATTTSIASLRLSGTINEGRIQIGDLRLASRDYAIDATGRLAFDGETNLNGNLVLTPEASRSLLSGSSILEALAGADEQVRIPIAVHGVYPDLRSRPSKDYLADAAARAVRLPGRDRAASFLRRLLGGDE